MTCLTKILLAALGLFGIKVIEVIILSWIIPLVFKK